MPSAPACPAVRLRFRGRVVPARPLALRGDEACVVLDVPPPADADVSLLLGWPDGRTTELGGRLREVAHDGRTARVDVLAVDGDWRPFLCFLGARASAPAG